MDLFFGRNGLVDGSFGSFQQKGSQNFMKVSNQLNTFFLYFFLRLVFIFPLSQSLKETWVVEQLRHYEIQERPQFFQIVLQRGSSDEQFQFGFQLS